MSFLIDMTGKRNTLYESLDIYWEFDEEFDGKLKTPVSPLKILKLMKILDFQVNHRFLC